MQLPSQSNIGLRFFFPEIREWPPSALIPSERGTVRGSSQFMAGDVPLNPVAPWHCRKSFGVRQQAPASLPPWRGGKRRSGESVCPPAVEVYP